MECSGVQCSAACKSERQNRSLLKRIKIAQIEKRNWKEELGSFLLMNRTTLHSTTGASPAEPLFSRKLPTRIPGIEEFPVDDQEIRDRDREAKEKGKLYADEKRCARESDVKEVDKVLLRQDRKNKLTPTFRPEPYHLVDKTGNCVVVESPDGVQYKRNSTHVKKSLSEVMRLNARCLYLILSQTVLLNMKHSQV